MIQRIQSAFLLLAACAFGGLFGMPIATSALPASPLLEDRVLDVTDVPALLILAGIGASLALVTIFLFRNRTLQVRLGFVLVALAFLLIGISYFRYTQISAAQAADVGLHVGPGLFLPAAAIVFGWLATVYVRKDEKIVRSMDRLR